MEIVRRVEVLSREYNRVGKNWDLMFPIEALKDGDF